jgi:hypothetical protein
MKVTDFIGEYEGIICGRDQDATVGVLPKGEADPDFVGDLLAKIQKSIGTASSPHRDPKVVFHHLVQQVEERDEIAFTGTVRTDEDVHGAQFQVQGFDGLKAFYFYIIQLNIYTPVVLNASEWNSSIIIRRTAHIPLSPVGWWFVVAINIIICLMSSIYLLFFSSPPPSQRLENAPGVKRR